MAKTLPCRDASPGLLTRREKVLRQEVEACEDPVCCCEAEPRWVRFRDAGERPAELSEWEAIERSPGEEL